MNRTVHTIWLDRERPERVGVVLGQWRRLNPGWEVVLHTDDALLHPEYRAFYDAATTPSIRADFLRLSLLERLGGVYCDLDAWPIAPLDAWMPTLGPDDVLAATLPMGVLDSWLLACRGGSDTLTQMRALACWLGDETMGQRQSRTLYASKLLERAERWRPKRLIDAPWQWFTTGRRSADRALIRAAIAGESIDAGDAKVLHYYAANQSTLT
jgi:hypothetical protein